ncbi:DUF6680 family protein, partial [Vibrio vulnificus]
IVGITVTIIASLLSGLIGVGISTWYYHRHEKRKQKYEVLRQMVGSRYALTERAGPEASVAFFSSINEVSVLFHDRPKVIEALKIMHREIGTPDRMQDNLTSLFKEMCVDLGIGNGGLNDEFFLRPFSPNQSLHNNPLNGDAEGGTLAGR